MAEHLYTEAYHAYLHIININIINRADAKSKTKQKNKEEKELEFLKFATNMDLEVKINTPQSSVQQSLTQSSRIPS